MLTVVCFAVFAVMAATGQPMAMNMAMNSTALPVPDSCVTDPTQSNCSTYTYPEANAVADLDSLCTAMPFMSSCSVRKACNQTGAANVSSSDAKICNTFNQVATICRLDTGMSKMKGCTNYNNMCANGSRVAQCKSYAGITTIPPTKIVNQRVRSVCEAMPHTGCELCLPSWKANATYGNCDLLVVYGSVCGEMPDMQECAEWDTMCTADPTLFVCTTHPAAIAAAGEQDNTTAAGSKAAVAKNATTLSDSTGAAAATKNSGAAAVMQLAFALLCMVATLAALQVLA